MDPERDELALAASSMYPAPDIEREAQESVDTATIMPGPSDTESRLARWLRLVDR